MSRSRRLLSKSRPVPHASVYVSPDANFKTNEHGEVVIDRRGRSGEEVNITVTAPSYKPGKIVAVLGSGDPTVSLSKTGARR